MFDIVIPTRNRHRLVGEFLAELNIISDNLVRSVTVVDSSEYVFRPPSELCFECTIIKVDKASSAWQRNVGYQRAVSKGAQVILFLDDDVRLRQGSLKNLAKTFANISDKVVAVGMNIHHRSDSSEYQGSRPSQWKMTRRFAELIGLYPSHCGLVAKSGWQSSLSDLEVSRFCDWLPSGACALIVDRLPLKYMPFDDWFEGYSYLEDVDMSLSLQKYGYLMAVSSVHVSHLIASNERPVGFQFGVMEVVNRRYIVTKHGLDNWRFILNVLFRSLVTIFDGVRLMKRSLILRGIGNIFGLCSGRGRFKP